MEMEESVDPTEAGFEALRDGDPERARRLLSESIEADAGNLRARKGLVQAARDLNDFSGAMSAFNDVIYHTDRRRDVVDAYLSKARLLDEAGNPNKAKEHYERALQFDNSLAHPYLALAELSLRTGQWQTAIGHADHGLEQAAHDARERPWMVLIRAIAQHKSSLSIGPVSSFFKMLGNAEDGPPGESALQQALRMAPELARLLPDDPFQDPARTAEIIRNNMPKFQIPTYRL